MTKQLPEDLPPEIRLRALELANSTVPHPTSGGSSGPWRTEPKDMPEIYRRANKILEWVCGIESSEPSRLIDRLRTVLCEER